MSYKRAFTMIGTGATIFVICAVAAMSGAGTVHGANAAQKMAGAEALPAAGTYVIDPVHTFAYFGARHHVVGLVRGRFDKVTGTVTVLQNPAACGVDVSIDVSSLNTQNSERDEDLQSSAYFDVKKFPAMTYHGRGIRRGPGNSWTMDGELSMHGVTKVVPLTFAFNGAFPDTKPGEPVRVAFHATAGVKRAEFGMGARDNLQELGASQAPDVEIEIDVEADSKLGAQ